MTTTTHTHNVWTDKGGHVTLKFRSSLFLEIIDMQESETHRENLTISFPGPEGKSLWESHWIEGLFEFTYLKNHLRVIVINTLFDPVASILDGIPDPSRVGIVIIDESNQFPIREMRRFLFVIRVGFAYHSYPANTMTVPLYLPYPTYEKAHCLQVMPGQRKFIWSFAGDATKNNDRRSMINLFNGLAPNSCHLHEGWMPESSLSPEQYCQEIKDSVFIPCPSGNLHVECYRAYEAAYLGAIPIVRTDYYRKNFNAPFLQARSWSVALKLAKDIVINGDLLNTKRNQVSHWIASLPSVIKSRVSLHLSKVIAGLY